MTKEQVRARYFAAHWGSKINVKIGDDTTTETIDGKLIDWVTSPMMFADCNVILRPLSAITDEHALLVFKLIGYNTSDMGSVISCAIVNFGNGLKIEIGTSDYEFMFIHNIADLLRSLGYHTGNFMGYDPIQEGWAVLNDKNDTI